MKAKLWLATKKIWLVTCIGLVLFSCVKDIISYSNIEDIYMPHVIRVYDNIGDGKTYKVKDEITVSIIIPNSTINGKTLKEHLIGPQGNYITTTEDETGTRIFTEEEVLDEGIRVVNFDIILSELYTDYPEFGLESSFLKFYVRGNGSGAVHNHIYYNEDLDVFESYLEVVVAEQIDPKTDIKYKTAQIRNNVSFEVGAVTIKTKVIENYEGEYFTLNIED